MPDSPARAARLATADSSAAAPAYTVSPSTVVAPSGHSSPQQTRSTAPSTPPSRTSRLLPLPKISTGVSVSRAALSATASAPASGGAIIASAGPPTPKVVQGASGSRNRMSTSGRSLRHSRAQA